MKKNGFTLVEVTLVIGVAGLIFAAAFIALPGLWASERDAARREDMMKFVTTLKNFQTNNNRGALPGNAGTDASRLGVGGQGVEVLFAGDDLTSTSEGVNFNDTSWAGFYRDYLGTTDFVDPDGTHYELYVTNCARTNDLGLGQPCNNGALADISTLTELDHKIYVAIGASCDGDTAVRNANIRKVAVTYKLERAGQYCYNS